MTEPRLLQVIRDAFVRDIGLKVVSLVASIALFYVIHGAEDAQKVVYFDVISRLPDASSGQMLVSDLPARLRVTLTGSPAQLNNVRQDPNLQIQLDLRDPSMRSYEFAPADFDLPVGVSVTDIDPPSVTLEWARRRERWVHIRPRLVGEPPRGLVVSDEATVEPASVLVIGPADEVGAFDLAETTEVDLAGLSAGANQRRVRLARPPAHSYYGEDDYVTVTLTAVPERGERTIARLDVAVLGGEVRQLRPNRVSVVVSGPPNVVQALDAELVVPYVDVADLRGAHGAQVVRVQVRGLPDTVELRRVTPSEILVTPEP